MVALYLFFNYQTIPQPAWGNAYWKRAFDVLRSIKEPKRCCLDSAIDRISCLPVWLFDLLRL